MPELPEVEITRRGIASQLVGQRVASVEVREPRLRWPVPASLARLRGQSVTGIRRRGKYLLIDCDRGHVIIHLGMSGSLRLLPAGTPPGRHDHVDLQLAGQVLRLRDPRRFGAVLWTEQRPELHPLLRDLGVEPLERGFDAGFLHAAARTRRVAIKLLLMDAHRVVGVGNIYASESLFLAGIDPRTRASRLTRERCVRLVRAIKQTLRAAIRAGGSSLRDFVASDGREGCFQRRHWVYDRAGQPCRRCATSIRRIVQGQRATYFCPSCQR
jgi:formamidopyrimidine-DNA glycosylase